jgi:hypothetical protein
MKLALLAAVLMLLAGCTANSGSDDAALKIQGHCGSTEFVDMIYSSNMTGACQGLCNTSYYSGYMLLEENRTHRCYCCPKKNGT